MGHNADDNAETSTFHSKMLGLLLVIMNIFRGDINRLTRGVPSDTPVLPTDAQTKSIVPRCKPME